MKSGDNIFDLATNKFIYKFIKKNLPQTLIFNLIGIAIAFGNPPPYIDPPQHHLTEQQEERVLNPPPRPAHDLAERTQFRHPVPAPVAANLDNKPASTKKPITTKKPRPTTTTTTRKPKTTTTRPTRPTRTTATQKPTTHKSTDPTSSQPQVKIHSDPFIIQNN